MIVDEANWANSLTKKQGVVMRNLETVALSLFLILPVVMPGTPALAQQEYIRVQERACGSDPLPACERLLREECGARPTQACYLTIKRRLDAINGDN